MAARNFYHLLSPLPSREMGELGAICRSRPNGLWSVQCSLNPGVITPKIKKRVSLDLTGSGDDLAKENGVRRGRAIIRHPAFQCANRMFENRRAGYAFAPFSRFETAFALYSRAA